MVDEKKTGIEESMDVIKFADALLDELGKHKADDGKIDTTEVFQTVGATMDEAVRAVVGSWKIGDELKDLDEDERKQLLDTSWPVVMKLIGLFVKVEA